jgi:hypothetical protein
MRRPFNPVLMLTVCLPAIAVLASFASLALAILRPDGELPEQYHWEGFRLDRDFDAAKHAAELEIRASFSMDATRNVCRLTLQAKGNAPKALTLILTHATQPSLDRRLVFRRVAQSGSGGDFEAPCAPLPDSHWRVELTDADNTWSVRQSLAGSIESWRLGAQAD